MGEPAPKVSLREITKETLRSILRLKVSEPQEDLVADNGNSIAQAHFDEKAWFRGIYAGETPVGFAMLSIDREKPEFYLWRFMIDEAQQGKGYGKRAMELLMERMRDEFEAKELTLHVMDLPHSARAFYESLGFTWAGEVEEDELVMRTEL
jgi:diamine N-acetyltransferase